MQKTDSTLKTYVDLEKTIPSNNRIVSYFYQNINLELNRNEDTQND